MYTTIHGLHHLKIKAGGRGRPTVVHGFLNIVFSAAMDRRVSTLENRDRFACKPHLGVRIRTGQHLQDRTNEDWSNFGRAIDLGRHGKTHVQHGGRVSVFPHVWCPNCGWFVTLGMPMVCVHPKLRLLGGQQSQTRSIFCQAGSLSKNGSLLEKAACGTAHVGVANRSRTSFLLALPWRTSSSHKII